MRNSFFLGTIFVVLIAILYCSLSKNISSEFGYRMKLKNLHDKADSFYKLTDYKSAIPVYEEIIFADSTFIYPDDRLSLHDCYLHLSQQADADSLLLNTTAAISKMKDSDSKVQLSSKFSKLLTEHEARKKRTVALQNWINEQKAQDSTFIVEYDSPPQPIGGFEAIQKKLVYPEPARKAGIQGTVTIYAKIDEHGKVVETKILQSVEESLDQAAINAVKAVDWIPAQKDDKPKAVWVSIPLKFKLK